MMLICIVICLTFKWTFCFVNSGAAPLGPITTFNADDGRIMMDSITNGKITDGMRRLAFLLGRSQMDQ